MVKEDKESEVIEHGDIFFFYRPKVDTQEVKDIEDVQRFYMVTSPEEEGQGKRDDNNNKDIYGLFNDVYSTFKGFHSPIYYSKNLYLRFIYYSIKMCDGQMLERNE